VLLWKNLHDIDCDDQLVDQAFCIRREMPVIATTSYSDLTMVSAGHADQPVTWEMMAVGIRRLGKAKGIDILEIISERRHRISSMATRPLAEAGKEIASVFTIICS
jgi:hypothetical protein